MNSGRLGKRSVSASTSKTCGPAVRAKRCELGAKAAAPATPASTATPAQPTPAEADAFVVLDSDLRTAPISLLPSVPLTRGAPLLVVGQTPTQYDRYARILVRAPSAGLMTAVADLIAPEG